MDLRRQRHLPRVFPALLLWLGCATAGPTPLPEPDEAPVDLDRPLVLVLTKGARYTATMEAETAPEHRSAIYYPVPPDGGSQSGVITTVSGVEAGRESPSEVIRDLSPLGRPVFVVRARAGSQVKVVAHLSLQTYQRRLANRAPDESPDAVVPLAEKERALYTRTTNTHPSARPEFLRWLKDHGLVRATGESPVQFAYRALQFMPGHFTYSLSLIGKAWGPMDVAEGGKGECNALAAIYVSILRANGIPARRVTGRELPSGASHNKAEFYADGVGWIPVEPTGMVSSKAPEKAPYYFGRDHGNFLVTMEDADLMLPNRGGSPYWIGALGSFFEVQSPGPLRGLKDVWHAEAVAEGTVSSR